MMQDREGSVHPVHGGVGGR
uniref:Uncharacterized protein n=1 Tax=Anguilla anguilla TaxID=7936 RepID=A0A0E9VWC5_ANGAN